MAAFSFSKQVDRATQTEYVAPLIHHLRDFLHERFEGLHKNPFLASLLRFTRTCAAPYPTGNAMNILYIKTDS